MAPGEQTHTAFFYGTLMVPAILNRVIQNPTIAIPSSHITTTPALLPAFRRHRVKFADYPAILPVNDREACVRGTLVSGLSDGDMARLDRFEGDEYERRDVKVRTLGEEAPASMGGAEVVNGGEAVVQAVTYVWIAGEKRLEEGEWDFEEFRKEKLWRWVGRDSREYQDVENEEEDEGSGKGGEDPTGGRGPDGSIGKALKDGTIADEVLKGAV